VVSAAVLFLVLVGFGAVHSIFIGILPWLRRRENSNIERNIRTIRGHKMTRRNGREIFKLPLLFTIYSLDLFRGLPCGCSHSREGKLACLLNKYKGKSLGTYGTSLGA